MPPALRGKRLNTENEKRHRPHEMTYCSLSRTGSKVGIGLILALELQCVAPRKPAL
jgi:hypothetical protein